MAAFSCRVVGLYRALVPRIQELAKYPVLSATTSALYPAKWQLETGQP